MATSNRGRGNSGRSSNSSNKNSGSARSPGSSNRASNGRGQATTREIAGGYAGGFIEAVKARPLRTAAIAAGTAGVSAFLWAKRAQLADQVASLSDAISDRFVTDESEPTGLETADSFKSQSAMSTPTQSSGKKNRKASSTDPMMAEQSEVGAISY